MRQGDLMSLLSALTGRGGGNGNGDDEITYWSPGYFQNEIRITNGTHVFLPGEYVLERGIKISGGTVTGSEVFFYNLNTSGNDFVDVGGNAGATQKGRERARAALVAALGKERRALELHWLGGQGKGRRSRAAAQPRAQRCG